MYAEECLNGGKDMFGELNMSHVDLSKVNSLAHSSGQLLGYRGLKTKTHIMAPKNVLIAKS